MTPARRWRCGDGPLAEIFDDAGRAVVVEEVAPVVETAVCTARLLDRRCRTALTGAGRPELRPGLTDPAWPTRPDLARRPFPQSGRRSARPGVGRVGQDGPAVGGQLPQMGPQRVAGHRQKLVAHVGVDPRAAARRRWPVGPATSGGGHHLLSPSRWAITAVTVAAGSAIRRPWPGAMPREGRLEPQQPLEAVEVDGHVPVGRARSPPSSRCMTWSPEKSIRSSTSSQQRWFEACPGVCRARSANRVPDSVNPSATARSGANPSRAPKPSTSAPVSPARAAAPGAVVGVGVGDHDPADPAAPPALGQGGQVTGVVGAGVDHRQLGRADQVGVGAGAGHHARVRRRDPDDPPGQRHRPPGDGDGPGTWGGGAQVSARRVRRSRYCG